MKTVQEYFCEYEQHHCNKWNKVTHYIGIPLIIIGLMGLLAQIPYLRFSIGVCTIDVAIMSIIAVYLLFYMRMHFLLSIFMLIFFSGFYVAGTYITNMNGIYGAWAFFIVGWILQLLGHVFEKEKPSFLDNAIHLLIGPFWILNRIVGCVK